MKSNEVCLTSSKTIFCNSDGRTPATTIGTNAWAEVQAQRLVKSVNDIRKAHPEVKIKDAIWNWCAEAIFTNADDPSFKALLKKIVKKSPWSNTILPNNEYCNRWAEARGIPLRIKIA